ncbi:MAG: rod shape-determining protein MreC [Clostridia bacterium]|nr:rod shape-determining protein MreC [Clostridia bacterium]
MSKKNSQKTKITVILILFLLILFIVYNFFGSKIYSSGQYFTAQISNKISNFLDNFTQKQELENKINNLQSEINILRDKVIDYEETKKENERLTKYYDLKSDNENLKFVPASVIGRDNLDAFSKITIDKGSNSGISVNNIVITENGVVGVVTDVKPSCSIVETLLSPNIKLGAFDIETDEAGIISGQACITNSPVTRMKYISPEKLYSGDIIVTSGISGLYPRNLKIGKVTNINYDSTDCYYYSDISLFEDPLKVQDLSVVVEF